MKSCLKLSLCLLLFLYGAIIHSQEAKANLWLECMVDAVLSPSEDTGVYSAEISRATVTNGFDEEGEQCMPGIVGQTLTLDLETKLPKSMLGKEVALKYFFYNGRGPEGVIREESWTLWNRLPF